MPRNGSGVYSKPAGTTAVANTVIESAKYNQTIDDLVADANATRPVTAGGTGGNSVQTAQSSLFVDNKVVLTTKSGSYTALLSDNNAVHRYTASATVTLTAAATLGANWHYTVVADGGDVTVDPNGSETVNGGPILTVPTGDSATIICDGSNFYTVMKPQGWEIVPGGHIVTSGVGSVNITNLGGFRRLWIVGKIIPSGGGSVYFKTSTNNGASYDSGATDYTYQYMQASGAAVSAARSTASSGPISANASNGVYFSTIIESFNDAIGCAAITDAQLATGGTIVLEKTTTARTDTTPRNAIQLITSAATLSCDVTIMGIRG